MCCSTSFLKFILGFFTFITLGVGIAGIVFGSIQLAHVGKVDFTEFNPAEISGGLLLGVGIIALFVGTVGLCGTSRKSKCCLCIFQFSVFPLLIIALAGAIIATMANIQSSDMQSTQDELVNCKYDMPECTGCGNDGMLQWVKKANTAIYEINANVFGQLDECQILAADGEQQEYYESLNYFKKVTTNPEVGVLKANDCELTGNAKHWADMMNYFEQEFQCSGMCAQTPFYTFYKSTVIPEDKPSCYHRISDFFASTMVLVISWSIFGLFFLQVLLSCCLCCHPDTKKEKSGENVYVRMNYYD